MIQPREVAQHVIGFVHDTAVIVRDADQHLDLAYIFAADPSSEAEWIPEFADTEPLPHAARLIPALVAVRATLAGVAEELARIEAEAQSQHDALL